MNEEILTALRGIALRSRVGADDADFIAALTPEIALELLQEIERRHGIQSELLECRSGMHALQLAFETERDAANLYAKQVAHWIGKHDALLEQQLAAQPVKQCLDCLHYNEPLVSQNCASCIHGGNVGDNFVALGKEYE